MSRPFLPLTPILSRALAAAVLLALSFPLMPAASADSNAPMQGLHQDIVSDMEELEPVLVPRMNILWRAAVKKNSTLQLALQKISEKTDPKTQEKHKSAWTKGLLTNMIQFGGMGGAFLTGSAAPLVGSSVLGRVAAPDAPAEARLTAVTSADLVILAREIEDAQTQLVANYLRYRQAREEATQRQTALDGLQRKAAEMVQDTSSMADMYRTIIADQVLKRQQALEAMQACRNLLVLAAGDAAVDELDKQDSGSIPTASLPRQAQSPPAQEQP